MQPRPIIAIVLAMVLAVLAGCSGTGGSSGSRAGGGGYYKDDGPGTNIPADIEAIPNAVPRVERHAPANFRPYVVFGKRYVPVSDEKPFRQQGTASWYGRKFHGKKTANGETYDMYAMSAAHPTLPIPSYARVTGANTGKSVIVRVNDRGPFHSSRIIDLSYVAAAKLGLIGPGSGQVIVEAITNQDIRNNTFDQPKAAPIPAAPPPEPPPVLFTQTQSVTPDALGILQDTAYVSRPDDAVQPTTVTHVVAAGAQIYLQFGAFSAPDTAYSLAQKINTQIEAVEHRNAHVKATDSLYRVQIGPYPSRTAAVNAALRIQDETGLQSSVAVR